MLAEQLSSDTLIALSVGELLGVVISLFGIIGGTIAYVRIDERKRAIVDQMQKDRAADNDRISKLEAAIATTNVQVMQTNSNVQQTTKEVGNLTEQVKQLMGALLTTPPAKSRKPTP